jgi:hypothetical protein
MTGQQEAGNGKRLADPLPQQEDELHPCDAVARTVPARRREHFFPIRKSVLIRILAEACPDDGSRSRFLQLCRLLDATFHHQYHDCLRTLKNAYAPFDPDADTCPLEELTASCREERAETLFREFRELLERANYRKLSEADIERALEAASDWGIHLALDLHIFEQLDVYARGDTTKPRQRRRLRNFYRRETVDLPIYQRLVIMFRLAEELRDEDPAETNTIYLKMFKNIPQMDLDMLLPGSRIRMSHVDHGKILLPTLSGVAIAIFKLAKGITLLATLTLQNVLAFAGLVGGTIGYGVKSLFGYLRTKDKYRLNLTRSLYYQNLDNNAGVLFRLLDEAEEQEVRETILAYFLLWQQAPACGWNADQLDRAAEAFVRDRTGRDVDFEIEDALDKLGRLGLARAEGQPARWRAVEPDEGLRLLDHGWDNVFAYAQERT